MEPNLNTIVNSAAHNPGGCVRLQVNPSIVTDAEFSSCGRYRPWLSRVWDSNLPAILFVGMNPSVADLEVDDPTVRKETGFAQRWGYGSLIKCNVMDYRATNPRHLVEPGVIPCSSRNLPAISQCLSRVQAVVAAWGVLPQSLRSHSCAANALLQKSGLPVWCLGTTKDNSPRHPLYLSNQSQRQQYQGDPNES